jgi:hypothetical protein
MDFRLFLAFGWLLLAGSPTQAQPREYAEKEVLAVLQVFFEALQEGDRSRAEAAFHPQAVLFSAPAGEEGEARPIALDDFLAALAAPREGRWEEKLWTRQVRLDGNLATVWTDYSFFVNGKLSHCGINAFQLVREHRVWQIVSLVDTRRRTACLESEPDLQAELDRLLDGWHRAAARADEAVFFGSMAPGAVYLGTDAGEYWLRDEFQAWSAPYFERDTAWDFTPRNRHWYFSSDARMA